MFDKRRAGGPRGSARRHRTKYSSSAAQWREETRDSTSSCTCDSSPEASRNTWLIYRGEQEHMADLQSRTGTHSSFTEEIRKTWLLYRGEELQKIAK